MPIIARELSATEVAAIAAPGTHAVGGVTGLCLQVTDTGARSWLLRISVDRRRREFGLGAYPTVTLAFARDQARALRTTIGGGIDPSVQRRVAAASLQTAKATIPTFKACAEAFAGAELSAGRNARYVNNTLAILQRVAFPLLGTLRVDAVTTEHVLGVIGPIWDRQHATATKVRGSIERVIAFAIKNAHREEPNPARWTNNLEKALAAPKSVRGTDHHAALPVDDMPAFMADLRGMPGVAARALEFMVLTATRPTDVREMQWPAVDLAKPAWNLGLDGDMSPGTVVIPLVDQTARILQTLAQECAHRYVFAAPRTGRALSDMALTAVIRRMNDERRQQGKRPWVDPDRATAPVVPSGLRTTFRNWASLDKNREAAAAALLTQTPSAQPPGTTAVDRQRAESYMSTLLAWARHCSRGHGA